MDRQYVSPRYLDCDVACLQDINDSNGGIVVTLSTPATAFAFDNFWPLTGSVTLSVTLAGFTENATAPSQQPAFFGFVSTTPFTTITISSSGTPNIYGVAVGTAATAPEPGEGTLTALGVLCLMSLARKSYNLHLFFACIELY